MLLAIARIDEKAAHIAMAVGCGVCKRVGRPVWRKVMYRRVAHVGALGVMASILELEHVNVQWRAIHRRITASLQPKHVGRVRLANIGLVVGVPRHLVQIGYAVEGHAQLCLQEPLSAMQLMVFVMPTLVLQVTPCACAAAAGNH